MNMRMWLFLSLSIIGGDQMTASRTRGSKGAVNNSENGADGLEGLILVVEDWHSKRCLLEVLQNI